MNPKTLSEIKNIRTSGLILAQVLKKIEKVLEPGISGIDIDQIARKELKKLGGRPAFLGVKGSPGVVDFPATICISINDAVVHGIPTDKPFKNGDIIGFDYGVNYDGMITDAARTFIIGKASDEAQLLVSATKHSLDAGISVIKAGVKTGDIGSAIQKVLEKNKLGIVRDLVGHGVGHKLHEEPEIPNFGFVGTGTTLTNGMTIAVEPMATLGGWWVVVDSSDGWTIRTRDGSLSAHFEDTLLVTSDGFEILTR
jgi:methionyl aminopeptidase